MPTDSTNQGWLRRWIGRLVQLLQSIKWKTADRILNRTPQRIVRVAKPTKLRICLLLDNPDNERALEQWAPEIDVSEWPVMAKATGVIAYLEVTEETGIVRRLATHLYVRPAKAIIQCRYAAQDDPE